MMKDVIDSKSGPVSGADRLELTEAVKEKVGLILGQRWADIS
jgi:hypothetical protein